MRNGFDLPTRVCDQLPCKIELNVGRRSIRRGAGLEVPCFDREFFTTFDPFQNFKMVPAVFGIIKFGLGIFGDCYNYSGRLTFDIQPAIRTSNCIPFFWHFVSFGYYCEGAIKAICYKGKTL